MVEHLLKIRETKGIPMRADTLAEGEVLSNKLSVG